MTLHMYLGDFVQSYVPVWSWVTLLVHWSTIPGSSEMKSQIKI